jgi:hypothetical protein
VKRVSRQAIHARARNTPQVALADLSPTSSRSCLILHLQRQHPDQAPTGVLPPDSLTPYRLTTHHRGGRFRGRMGVPPMMLTQRRPPAIPAVSRRLCWRTQGASSDAHSSLTSDRTDSFTTALHAVNAVAHHRLTARACTEPTLRLTGAYFTSTALPTRHPDAADVRPLPPPGVRHRLLRPTGMFHGAHGNQRWGNLRARKRFAVYRCSLWTGQPSSTPDRRRLGPPV